MSDYQTLRLDLAPPRATVTLTRPQCANAFNEVLIAELTAVFTLLSARKEVRAIVFTGEGASFCAGAEIEWMRNLGRASHEENVRAAKEMAAMFQAVARCPKPVIGRIQGPAIGGGVGLVAACDIVLASDKARFAFSEVRLGIIPAVIAPFVIAKVGPGHAKAVFLTGERFDAERALRIGLVHEVHHLDVLDAAVDRAVSAVTQGGPIALAEAKRLVDTLSMREWEIESALTAEWISRLRGSAEGQEGLAAFLEKRTAAWATKE